MIHLFECEEPLLVSLQLDLLLLDLGVQVGLVRRNVLDVLRRLLKRHLLCKSHSHRVAR